MAEWRRAVLRAIGAPVTPQNMKFLSTWQRWEGGHTKNDARFNWLNTTRGTGRSINGVGVKAFGDFNTGVRYTAETLMNGKYDDIVRGLSKGDPYKFDVSSGLQTWVSGSPTGNPGYAAKVMGGSSAPKAAQPRGGRGPVGDPGLALPPPMKYETGFDPAFVQDIFGFDLGNMYSKLYPQKTITVDPYANERNAVGGQTTKATRASRDTGPTSPHKANGKTLRIPDNPHGTHNTDGLWSSKTAEDIMASPGTAVKAPGSGKVVYWHPTGAQGGGSMLIRLDNGKEYWLGHIANGVKAGTRFKAGQTLALISSDHKAPHLHVDDGE